MESTKMWEEVNKAFLRIKPKMSDIIQKETYKLFKSLSKQYLDQGSRTLVLDALNGLINSEVGMYTIIGMFKSEGLVGRGRILSR